MNVVVDTWTPEKNPLLSLAKIKAFDNEAGIKIIFLVFVFVHVHEDTLRSNYTHLMQRFFQVSKIFKKDFCCNTNITVPYHKLQAVEDGTKWTMVCLKKWKPCTDLYPYLTHTLDKKGYDPTHGRCL